MLLATAEASESDAIRSIDSEGTKPGGCGISAASMLARGVAPVAALLNFPYAHAQIIKKGRGSRHMYIKINIF